MRFALPQSWREPTNHHDDCFYCMVDISGHTCGKNGPKSICFPDISSSITRVPHCDGLPDPESPPPENQSNSKDEKQPKDPSEELLYCDEDDKKPHFPNQSDINELIIRDLNLKIENGI